MDERLCQQHVHQPGDDHPPHRTMMVVPRDAMQPGVHGTRARGDVDAGHHPVGERGLRAARAGPGAIRGRAADAGGRVARGDGALRRWCLLEVAPSAPARRYSTKVDSNEKSRVGSARSSHERFVPRASALAGVQHQERLRASVLRVPQRIANLRWSLGFRVQVSGSRDGRDAAASPRSLSGPGRRAPARASAALRALPSCRASAGCGLRSPARRPRRGAGRGAVRGGVGTPRVAEEARCIDVHGKHELVSTSTR